MTAIPVEGCFASMAFAVIIGKVWFVAVMIGTAYGGEDERTIRILRAKRNRSRHVYGVCRYSTVLQQKYQGMFLTESKLNIGGSELAPGEYGFAFAADKFVVMNAATKTYSAYPARPMQI